MTTVATWIETVKDHVLSGYREEQDILNGAIDAATTTLTTTDATDGIQPGTEIEVDLERMYVRTVAGTTVTVRRGYRGSTSASHANGADIIVLPKVPKSSILRELNTELNSLSSPTNGIFRVRTVDLSWSGSFSGYDLTGVTDIEDVLEVRWEDYGPWRDWPLVNPGDYSLAREMATSEFASGSALLFSEGIAPGQSVRVRYSAPFTALTAVDQDVETVSGLPSTAIDIPPLGAAINLIGSRDIRRTFEGQGDTRADDDVRGGDATGAIRYLIARREERIKEEAARIASDFPVLLRR